ncbi:MAG: hypothetical protein Tsb0020_17120 [Haliangiales bacterium]
MKLASPHLRTPAGRIWPLIIALHLGCGGGSGAEGTNPSAEPRSANGELLSADVPRAKLVEIPNTSVTFKDIEVPAAHPRLWWTQETLATAKAWHKRVGWEPSGKPELSIHDGRLAVDNAMMYLFTREPAYARRAIAWAKLALAAIEPVDFDDGAGTCNECRWYARDLLLTLDWCYDQLSEAEWQRFYQSLNRVIPRWNTASWGNPEQVVSNFNHGYMVQTLLWGLMIYHEDRELAVEQLTHAYEQRWARFRDYTHDAGVGGIPPEGSSYNDKLLAYHVESAESLKNVGFDYYQETDFFQKSVLFNIYNTVPQPVYLGPDEDKAYWNVFPYGDSGAFMNINPWSEVLHADYTKFQLWAAHRWQGRGMLAKYARGWVEALSLLDANAPPPGYIRAITEHLPSAPMNTLPLDYFAPGGGHVPYGYSRSSWGRDSTAISVQLGKPPLGGHEHQDAGTFSIVRGARWLVMTVAGRGYGSGWQVPNYARDGGVDVHNTVAKNTLLFGGEGQNGRGFTTGNVTRLESKPAYFYAANDLTPAYQSLANQSFENPNIERFEREFLFVKPLETLLVFDRTKSRAGADQRKTLLLHTQGKPTPHGKDRYLVTNVDQQAVIWRLLPSRGADVAVIDESGHGSQTRRDRPYRLQVESDASGVVHFLTVIQAKAKGDPELDVKLVDRGDNYEITLTHPRRGRAVVRFAPGLVSRGGSFGYSESGRPTLSPLRADAQELRVTLEDGPKWVH